MKTSTTLFLSFFLSCQFILAQNFYVNEDFNSSTIPTSWSNIAVTGGIPWSATSAVNIDGTPLLIFDDDQAGPNAVNRVELTTGIFNNSSSSQTFLEFDYNFRTFTPAPTDSFFVQVFDGTSWNTVFSEVNNNCGNFIGSNCINNGFPHAIINISSFNNSNCQVRFVYDDGGDYEWYVAIDNVEIYSPFADNLGVTEVLSPKTGCGLTSSENIQVRIKNLGLNPANGFDVSFNLDNGVQVATETIISTLAPKDSLDYTFLASSNFSAVKSYSLVAYTSYTSDADTSDDSTSVQISNSPLLTLPYAESFESDSGDWVSSGTNNSWKWGVPSGTAINSASNGSNAFVTNLIGGYNGNEISYLTSPCLDFSNGGDPLLSFDLNYLTEANFDYLTLESSINNGLSWQKVDSAFGANNWYNRNISGIGRAWNGNSQGWIPVRNTLTGLAGQANVKLRFVFKSDLGFNLEGIGIDNILIRHPDSIDLALNSILGLGTGSQSLCGASNSPLRIEVANFGTNSIDTVFGFFKINSQPTVSDTIIQSISSYSISALNFNATPSFRMNAIDTLSVWIKAKGDLITSNDSTLSYLVSNNVGNIETTPFFENFDGLPFVSGFSFSNNNSSIGSSWSRSPLPNQYCWNVATGASYRSPSTGPNSDHSSGSGNIIYTEASNGTNGSVATIETPCIQLNSLSNYDLQFWSYRYGVTMGPLYVDIYDGANWVLGAYVVSGTQQTNGSQPWTFNQFNLAAYAGSRIKVRFRAVSQGCCAGDIAIDDVRVYERFPIDAQIDSLISPKPSCGLGTAELITVALSNVGSTTIDGDSLRISYQVDNLPIVVDTLRTAIAVNANTQFTFSTPANFNTSGKVYNLSVWVELNRDGENSNDSLLNVKIKNPRKTVPFKDNFEASVDINCDATAGQIIANDWKSSTLNGNATWHLQDASLCSGSSGATTAIGTGPAGDHTTGNGKFLFMKSSGISGSAELRSGCFDFTNQTSVSISFWYHKYGSAQGNLLLLAKNVSASVWDTIITIAGQTQTSYSSPWLRSVSNLNQYAGNVVEFKFQGNASGSAGEVALDDITIFEPSALDANLSSIDAPSSGCSLGSAETVSITVENFGTQTIMPNSLNLSYQLNNGPIINELLNAMILPGAFRTYDFNTTADFSNSNTIYNLKVWSSLVGDNNPINDSLLDFTVENSRKSLGFTDDFESFSDFSCNTNYLQRIGNGWRINNVAGGAEWTVQNAGSCLFGSNTVTPSPFSGPSGDHTTGIGNLMYATSTFNTIGVTEFISPCLDFANQNSIEMAYWYHKYGINMGEIRIEAKNIDSTNWVVLQTIAGVTQSNFSDPWLKSTVNLNSFAGQVIEVKIVADSVRIHGDMAIDDISFYDPLLTELANTQEQTEKPSLYPNPNDGSFMLMVPASFVQQTYQLFDMNGRLIQEGRLSAELNEFRINAKSKGIYFLRIAESNFTEKIIVY